MTTNTQPPKEKRQYIKYKALLALLPKHNFNESAAARETKLFSEGYIRSGSLAKILKGNEWYQWQKNRLLEENLSLQKDKAETIYTLIDHVIDTGEYKGQPITPTVLCRLLDIRLKTLHAYGMDRGDEQDQPQKQLTAKQLEAARKQSLKLIQGKAS